MLGVDRVMDAELGCLLILHSLPLECHLGTQAYPQGWLICLIITTCSWSLVDTSYLRQTGHCGFYQEYAFLREIVTKLSGMKFGSQTFGL